MRLGALPDHENPIAHKYMKQQTDFIQLETLVKILLGSKLGGFVEENVLA